MRRTLCLIILLISFLLPLRASAETTTETLETCKALLEYALETNDASAYEIGCDNTGFTIYNTVEGIFFRCVSYATGLSDIAQWESYVESKVDHAETILNFIHEVAGEHLSLLYVVVDTSGHDVPYLVIYNGTVVYDSMPTWSWFFGKP